MLRRRLRLSYSSDEDEELHSSNQPHQHPHEEPQPQVSEFNPNPTPNHSDPLEISDDAAAAAADFIEVSDSDDFIDVSDNLSPPSPPLAPPPPAPNSGHRPSPVGSPIGDFLLGLGLRLKREWLDSCVRGLEQSVPGFGELGVAVKAKLCFERFLLSDMNQSAGGILPENVDRFHLVDLPGPYVLQVDEIVNISCPLKGRYQKAPPGIKRCLKLSMTDGVQRVFGMEYRPIKDLDALAPAGLKVVICNVHIRRGLLMLVPEAFEVLGGLVEELEAARQRLVDEVNKPPRGIRTRNRVVPHLRTRATNAAWPSGNAHVAGNSHNATSDQRTPLPVYNQAAFVAPGTDTSERIEEEFPVPVSEEISVRNPSANVILGTEEFPDTYVAPSTDSAQMIEEEFPGLVGEENFRHNTSPNIVFSAEEFSVPGSAESAIPSLSSNAVTGSEGLHRKTLPTSSASAVRGPSSDVASVLDETDMDSIPRSMTYPVSGPDLNDVINDEENLTVDEVEHPLILSGVREIPFTYLASLSAKWAAMKGKAHSVKGIIKCFLTGVKEFQYKDRTTYYLRAYVDDGSLISEILIDHEVVQKVIGHSPQEVTAALSSSDVAIVRNIKDTLKQFQKFLVNFEGKMLIEMNATSLPVALEMNEGCPESDAELLLGRLKSSISSQTQRSLPVDPIDLSP
ncbi:RecQ mediated genome instability protein [Parasponia andersonii]|uniref:RecQ-mediated genome instability protein 1 n=1 Tax=Parasponia andersonii TaxID=3476 RepID=A0A2P5DVD4_PARAD|nr:RecQ mediated genome instability protein [Parasponia andersonii]